MLVGSITVSTIDAALAEIAQINSLADAIELRLDYFTEEALSQLGKIMPELKLPVIFTFRKKSQGGAREISEEQRLNKIEKLLEYLPDFCDLEAETNPAFIEKIAEKFPKLKLIGSYHNFEETPRNLNSLLQEMENPRFSIYKIAARAKSTLDMLKMMIFAIEAKVPICCISIGEYGKPSRILGPVVGNVLNYSGLVEDAALHRCSLKELLEIYHYRKLNKQTQIYGLIGDPIEKSPGHLFHNPRFKQNGVYIKMRLEGEETPEFFKIIKQLPFRGLSVTIPLKEAVFTLMDELDFSAKEIGAVNTVDIRENRTVGFNTDGKGALNAIEKHFLVKNKRLAILGAGGSARAIAYEALRRGAAVSIYNRTEERAKKLAAILGCSGYSLEEIQPYDLMINTIPSKSEIIPKLQKGTPVMDIVYSPKETPLLTLAKKLGCECIYGEEMFCEQADLQQLIWRDSISS